MTAFRRLPNLLALLPSASCLLPFAFCLLPLPLHAISVGKAVEDPSPEAELRSFTVLDGFEVSLWASEKDGLTKPISMRWDERGRLWVITAAAYPQPEPGEVFNDKVLILEDTKHSGHADKVTVFADGLRMPMGIELAPSATWPQSVEGSLPSNQKTAGSGRLPETPSERHPMAAYIGEGEKLWIMRDLDGDGKADVKEVVFSGFGTGDVHQCINSFTWTPDGALMFSQGLHCYSNVTTPWGGRRLYGAGFWMYRPLRAQLTPYPTGFPLNAWGTVYDDAGQPFTVAGAAGMFWTTPLLVPQYGTGSAGISAGSSGNAAGKEAGAPSYSVHLIEGRALPNQGQIVKQGMLKYCGVDIPRNAHWPADMHGELVSGGFFENCIYRHKLQTDKANPSGYEALRQPDLLKSSSVAFRPVDVKFGPDGALYISDWYNPIIGHYQASFRHPDRDKTHGRIWRVVKKGVPLVNKVALTMLSSLPVDKNASNPTRFVLTGGISKGGKTGAGDGGARATELHSDLGKASTHELMLVLRGGDRWAQYQAQRLLMGRLASDVFSTENRMFFTTVATFSSLAREGRGDLVFSRLLQLHECFETFDSGGLRVNLTMPSNADYAHPGVSRIAAIRAIGLWHEHGLDIGNGREESALSLLGNATSESVAPIADEDPRVRLEAIVACAQIPRPESIAIALRALDKPSVGGSLPPSAASPVGRLPTTPAAPAQQPPYFDSFHERTLELTVHALAPYWEPALRDGKLTLPPKHLAWLLDKKSDGDTLAVVRAMLRKADLQSASPTGVPPVAHTSASGRKPEGHADGTSALQLDSESRRALLLVLAKRGGEEDLRNALAEASKDWPLLPELVDVIESNNLPVPEGASAFLAESGRMIHFAVGYEENGFAIGEPLTPEQRKSSQATAAAVFRLIGHWKLKGALPALKRLEDRAFVGEATRQHYIALAKLGAEQEFLQKTAADEKKPFAMRSYAIEALAINHITPAAKAALVLMLQAKTEEDMRALLAPFLVKAGRVKPLIAAVTETPPSKEAADLASRALAMMGRNEPELSAALNKILGRATAAPPYNFQFVSSLANEATVAGNAKRGDEIFHRVSLNCLACHQIKNQGGIIGPQLDAVGRGVPVELLVEAVLWPQRQIKEGYVATTVVMKDGRSLVGYKQKETEAELTVRDLASATLSTLQKSQMQTRTDAGSLMPDGLTASLSREELRDLIAYLASLGKDPK